MSAYEDKVVGKIPEDICVGLLNKYQDEKTELLIEQSEIELREIHIYYKLIDKTPLPEKKYLITPTCEDC